MKLKFVHLSLAAATSQESQKWTWGGFSLFLLCLDEFVFHFTVFVSLALDPDDGR
jgi:hypothetical protein